jgi:hypothetical protein
VEGCGWKQVEYCGCIGEYVPGRVDDSVVLLVGTVEVFGLCAGQMIVYFSIAFINYELTSNIHNLFYSI